MADDEFLDIECGSVLDADIIKAMDAGENQAVILRLTVARSPTSKDAPADIFSSHLTPDYAVRLGQRLVEVGTELQGSVH